MDISTYGEDDPVENNSGQIERLPPFAQVEMRPLEVIWRHGKTQQGDQPISGGRRNTTRGDQGCERDLTGENRAQDECAEDEHDSDRVARLA